ncbi:CapK protein [Cellulophaga geojensis KL-A]|uniref:CapK protein n=1 Tax=Cellulophaga geojensis KL-A TaxID=1328323 RepID=A0ABN0RQ34_9FLAO|nr:phenylacetate--CoA ligase family protein [Cellulophaga geojensis]EWH14035.1 CapK protein [Cellulophaga geojensis KL-A]
MSGLKEKIYSKSPHFIQNCIISVFNIKSYKKRYNSNYKEYLKIYKDNNTLSSVELQHLQKEKYQKFLEYTISKSPFYKNLYKNIEDPTLLENIRKLPIVNKEVLRNNTNDIYTIPKNEGSISKTGGTTGKSLEVLFLKEDIEERFAILDNFRNQFGYKLGKKTAWFSGKSLLSTSDVKRNRFWKTDYYYNVRYYSTFHIHQKYLSYYLDNLITYSPEYLVGFPSTMYELAKYGLAQKIDFPSNTIKAIFPTAETITTEIRTVLESFFKTNVYNQYASSEGAPFIIECKNKKLHLELQSGVFEVLDANDQPTQKGRLIVTAFHTHGTPLIRYDIGDEIELSNNSCTCGNNNPTVKQILGRSTDYIYSSETGKINLGNISNCLKGVKGIVQFQIQQHTPEKIQVFVVKDTEIYTKKDEVIFITNLKDRVGDTMEIKLNYVSEIPVEKSGKFRLVKNNIKK